MDPFQDVEAYLNQYPERLRLTRALRLIRCADSLSSTAEHSDIQRDIFRALFLTAAPITLDLIVKLSTNTALYRDTLAQCFEKGADVQEKCDLLRRVEIAGSEALERWGQECHKAQQAVEAATSNILSLKDSWGEALQRLSQCYASRGDAQKAHKTLLHWQKDCASSDEQQLHAVIETIMLFFQLEQFYPAAGQIARLEVLVRSPAAKCTDGQFIFFVVTDTLLELEKKNYHAVAAFANRVLRTGSNTAALLSSLTKHVSDTGITTLKDMVLISSLCALATSSRQALSEYMGITHLKGWLEEDPSLNVLLTTFHECKFDRALVELSTILSKRLSVDLFFHSHVGPMRKKIRDAALLQYIAPYLSVSLSSMALAFSMSVDALERELRQLIETGVMNCRIDSANGLLRMKHIDKEAQTVKLVLETGKKMIHESEQCSRWLSLQRNGVILRELASQRTKRAAPPPGRGPLGPSRYRDDDDFQ